MRLLALALLLVVAACDALDHLPYAPLPSCHNTDTYTVSVRDDTATMIGHRCGWPGTDTTRWRVP